MDGPDIAAPRLLIADDQPDVIEALRLLLKQEGYIIETARSPAAVLQAVEAREFSALLMDLNYARDTTSGHEGLDLLPKLQTADPTLPIVVMTAWGSIDVAVEAMRRGARDFLTKPWDNPRLLAIIRNQVDYSGSLRACRRLEEETRVLRNSPIPGMIARSAAMQPILDVIARVGPTDANVLITGENGTGKGLVARTLHNLSKRAERAFIPVNLGGLPAGVFESEIFGHVRGAFTDARSDRAGRLELADGGTLFLDEIGHVPPDQQLKILRTLETGEYERVGSSRTHRANVRLIAATNADLAAEIAAGRFRQDLFFRLNTIHLQLPPLRERREDIEPLARHFLAQHTARHGQPIADFEPEAIAALQAHRWPGNVRELDHAVERAVLMAEGRTVHARHLGLGGPPGTAGLDTMSLDDLEVHLIQRTLARCNGNARQAASALGLSRSAFYRRLEKHGL